MRTLLALLAVGALASPSYAATAKLVVMSTNPNGVPSVGNQYLLGVQVAGAAGPTFLGSNLVSFTGSIGHSDAPGAFAAQPGSFYHGPDVLFQSESDLAHATDAANYTRTNDSYFAGTWRTFLTFAQGGAGETANSMFIDFGLSNALPAQVPGNGTYPFAYINVSGAPGVQIEGTFAIGTQAAPVGNGQGLTLALNGTLTRNGFAADFNTDDSVTGADLTVWRGAFALTTSADADQDGDSDGADFLTWQRQQGSAAITAANSPEPASGCLLLGLAAAALLKTRVRIHH